MSYCPKCGNKVDETMVFCPHCGASLKGTPTSQPTPTQLYPRNEKSEKNEKHEKQTNRDRPEKAETQEKGERGFIGYLIGGLILITFGLFSVLQLSGYFGTRFRTKLGYHAVDNRSNHNLRRHLRCVDCTKAFSATSLNCPT